MTAHTKADPSSLPLALLATFVQFKDFAPQSLARGEHTRCFDCSAATMAH